MRKAIVKEAKSATKLAKPWYFTHVQTDRAEWDGGYEGKKEKQKASTA